MNHRLLSCFTFIVGLGFLAGCQNVDGRIRKNPEAFASADQATQDKIKQGIIDLGFSENSVYLALGSPVQKRKSVSFTGQTETWVYYASSDLNSNIIHPGYYRRTYNEKLEAYCDVFVPATFEDGVPGIREYVHVVFTDGKVSMIERTQNGANVGLQPGLPVRVSARGSSGS